MAGIALPQLAPASEDRVSGAQVIDGSLKFDRDAKTHLFKTFGKRGSSSRYTWSYWIKRTKFGVGDQRVFSSSAGNGNPGFVNWFTSNDVLEARHYNGSAWDVVFQTTNKFRDTGWYHIVCTVDVTESAATDRVKIYVNGTRETLFNTTTYGPARYAPLVFNGSNKSAIGSGTNNGNEALDAHLSNYYAIDGFALGPESFGYTDPLTGVWRPKKFSGELNPPFSDNWEDDTTGTGFNADTNKQNAFDGNPDSQAATGQNGTMSFTPTPAITGISKVRIKARRDSGANVDANFTLNGTTIGDLWTAGNVATVEITSLGGSPISQLTNLTWKGNTNNNEWFGVYMIEVYSNGAYHTLRQGGNAFYLPMDGDSPVGEDKSDKVTLNDGTVWSSFLTSSTNNFYTGAQGVDKAFDGDTSTYVQQVGGTNPNYITFTPSGGIAHTSTVEVWINNTQNEVSYNGGSLQSISSGWNTIATGSGTLTSIRVERPSTSGAAFGAIRIDGVVLIDGVKGNSFRPKYFGGSVTLDKATGALPILNTGSGGNVARPGVFGSEASAFYETTSASNSGGKYYFSHDASAQPTFSFVRGATYTFDYSASSSHPLRFATAADAAGSTEYTDGTSISGNIIKFTVPHNAPDTLYYYCNVHNGMGNSISVTTEETKADPYSWKNVLALPLVSTANDVSNQINNGSTTKAVTVTGPVSSGAQSNFYGGSYYFDGSNDELNIPDSADWDIGSGDFTIELWVNQVEITNQSSMVICQWGASGTSGVWYIQYDSLTSLAVNFRDDSNLNNSGNPVSMTAPASPNRWQHIAVTRNGNTWRLFVDGILQNYVTSSITVANATEPLRVGRQGYTSYRNGQPFKGYIQDVRFYKGVAKYTSDFIPAATSPDVLPDSPSSTAVKPQLTKITDGAVAFDGTNDNLTIPAHSDLDLSSGDFTVEGFVYPQRSQEQSFVTNWNSGGQFQVQMSSSGTLQASWAPYSTGSYAVTGSTPIRVNSWSHFAYTRSGNTFELFLDGISQGTQTSSANGSTNNNIVLGENGGNGDRDLQGFLSNVRIIKGTALYTSNFTPPTRELTNVTNTKLLCCQSNVTSGAAAVSPSISGINDGTVWSHQNSFVIAVAGTTETGSLAAVFNPTTGVTGAADSFGFLNGAFDFTYTPDAPIPYSSKVRVWTGFGGSVYLNNGSAVSAQNNNWTTLATGSSGTITSIRFTASGSGGWWSGLEVDDVMLVDPVNTNGNAAATNFNPFNSVIDAVRGQEGNYATLNPNTPIGSNCTFSNGNLDVSVGNSSSNGNRGIRGVSTIGMTSGKWYCEHVITGGATARSNIGVIGDPDYGSDDGSGNYWVGRGAKDYIVWSQGGQAYTGSGQSYAYGVAWGVGDVIGCAFDADEGKMYIYKNGTAMNNGTPSHTGLTDGPYWFIFTEVGSNISVNFGQKPFKFPPPDGFVPLSSSTARTDATDTTPTITRPGDFVGATTYIGNNSNPRNLDFGHPTDLVWIKKRNATENNNISDSVRGPNNWISSDNNNAANTGGGPVLGFNDDGVTTDNNGYVNGNNDKYVAWSWRAGGKDGSNAFNIDDVGYANASDVNMNVGGLNSSAYDQSQVWSNYLTTNETGTQSYCNSDGFYENNGSGHMATEGFNGTLNTTTATCNDGDGKRITFTPPSAYAYTSKVEVYLHGSQVNSVYINGTDTGVDTAANSWATVATGSGSITSMWFESDNSGHAARFAAIRIDGKMLVDSGTDLSGLTQYPTIVPTGCSVGTKQGFSILKWNSGGSNGNFTLGHGLGREPKFIITRSLASANTWVYHASQVGTDYRKYLQLNSNSGDQTNSANFWGESGHTDILYGVRVGDLIGQNQNAISYLWADVPGLQKFGSYTANGDGSGGGDEDGPFVELGFRPAMILFKGSHTSDWTWIDNARCTTNYNDVGLRANYHYGEIGNARGGVGSSSQPENYAVDFLSNGFKIRASGGSLNGGTNTIYYAAWAEAPQFNLYGAQSNAR